MADLADIRALSDWIAAEFRPQRIVLFGSYARGTATVGSDVDLLVVMPFEGSASRQAAEIRRRLDVPFGVDVVVRTPRDLEERLALGDYFLREIAEQGRTLYESAHA